MKPKIFVYVTGSYESGDVVAQALAEDGHALAGHLSSSETWAKHDMGLASTWKHDRYNAHYPDGWELEWVDEPKTHEGVRAAMVKNHALFAPDCPEASR